MRFTPGWAMFLIFGLGATVGVASAFMGYTILGPLTAIVYLFPMSIFLRDRLTTFVIVDDKGISWRDGRERRTLSWDKIAGCLVERQEGGPPKLYLVEMETLDSHELPLFRAALFKAVARRRGRFRLQLTRVGRPGHPSLVSRFS